MDAFEKVGPAPDVPASAEDVVDETLIVEMLRLTPLERLRQNDRMLKSIAALRAAFDALDLQRVEPT